AELSDHPQRFPADIRSAAFSGHTDTAKIVHGFANSRLTEEVPGSALRRRGLPLGSSGIRPALDSGQRWLARRRTSRRVKEARADHKVRASSATPEKETGSGSNPSSFRTCAADYRSMLAIMSSQ